MQIQKSASIFFHVQEIQVHKRQKYKKSPLHPEGYRGEYLYNQLFRNKSQKQ